MLGQEKDQEIYSLAQPLFWRIEKVSTTTAIVFANSYVNTISFLPRIEEQLASMNFSGEVIFDLLFSNGNAFNRIAVSNAVRGKVDRKAFRIVSLSSLEEVVLEKIKAFYESNSALLESNFILSDQEKEALLR